MTAAEVINLGGDASQVRIEVQFPGQKPRTLVRCPRCGYYEEEDNEFIQEARATAKKAAAQAGFGHIEDIAKLEEIMSRHLNQMRPWPQTPRSKWGKR